jgi:hypothetical protein
VDLAVARDCRVGCGLKLGFDGHVSFDTVNISVREFQVRYRLDQRCVFDIAELTFTPACDNAVAIPSPMPDAAPVTNALLPAISIMLLFLKSCATLDHC